MKKSKSTRTALLKKIYSKKKFSIIVLHDNPDPDAIAAGWGFKFYIKKRFNIDSAIVYGGIIARAENKAMVRRLRIELISWADIVIPANPSYVLIDTQPCTGNNSLPPDIVPDIVIDHHQARKKIDIPFSDIRPDIGSTASIIYEYLSEENYPLPKLLATALYYGINSETRDLGREVNSLDEKACINLFPSTSKKILSGIIHPKHTKEYFSVLALALKKAKVNDTSAFCHLGEVPFPDYIHQIADLLLSCENIRWSLCSGWSGSVLYLSLRATNPRAKAGILVKKLVGSRGKAGGHDTMAGGKLEFSVEGLPSTHAYIEELVTRRFAKYCSKNSESSFHDLISNDPICS